ncbi:MAG: TonB-dependent receptor [Pseudomonadota bacterium]
MRHSPTNARIAALTLATAISGTVLAQQEPAMEEIIVFGSQITLPAPYAGGQVARGGRAGMLGNLDMMDSPFASTNFTHDLMLGQQAVSVADVLQNEPTVRVAKGFGNFQELYMIRGFPVFSDDMTYNGVYGILPRQFVATELLERVEVFRGASAFLNGAAPGGSSLGGTVNLVPKRAPEGGLTRLTTGVESGGHAMAALDLGRRFGADDSTGVRANLVRRDGETAIDDQDRELTVASLGVDHQGDRLRLSVDIGWQDHHIDSPRPSVTPNAGIPSPPDTETNFAQPWTHTDEQQLFGVVRGEYDLTDNTTVWVAAGMREGEESNVLANPNANEDGSTSAYRFDNAREDDVRSGEIGLRSGFDTGAVRHDITVSASAFSLKSRNAYAFSSFTGFAGDLYAPVAVTPPSPDFFTGGSLNDPLVTEETETTSLAIADMLSFMNDRLLVTLGARHQTIETRSFNYNSGAAQSGYDESRATPVAGVVYKLDESISVYGNYIEGLLPGETAPSTSGGDAVTNAGEVFEPYRAKQVEAGLKYDNGSIGGSLSAYDTARPSSYVEDHVFSTFGEQRNRGIELNAFGALTESIRVLGGITLIDAELTQTQGGAFDGNDAVGSPDTQINLNVEWDISALPGLTLEARSLYTAAQYANQANSIEVSSWTRVDLGARYSTRLYGNDLTLRARLNNAGDSEDWSSVGGFPGSNYLVLAEPRSLQISASVNF